MSDTERPPTPAPADDPTGAAPESEVATTRGKDPLRRSRVSHVWFAVGSLAVVLVLLTIFIAQNTARVTVQFLGWNWHAPLAVVLLAGVVGGMILVLVAGTLRIVQLRLRVRHQA